MCECFIQLEKTFIALGTLNSVKFALHRILSINAKNQNYILGFFSLDIF